MAFWLSFAQPGPWWLTPSLMEVALEPSRECGGPAPTDSEPEVTFPHLLTRTSQRPQASCLWAPGGSAEESRAVSSPQPRLWCLIKTVFKI